MTGYVWTYDGRRERLPALLQWSIKLTDGEPCDSFCVRFVYSRQLCTAAKRGEHRIL